MAAVSQTIQQYLAGVSREPDKNKQLGSVKEAINAYPDTTFGLVKRPGTYLNAELGNSSDLDDAYFFPFNYDDSTEQYICAVYGQSLKIWNLATGVQATILDSIGGNPITTIPYLNGTKEQFRHIQRRDNLALLNTSVVVSMDTALAPGTLTGTVNTIAELPAANTLSQSGGEIYRINGIDGAADDYVIRWDGQTWAETVLPGELISFDASTLPYLLTRTSTDNFTFTPSPWTNRVSGISGNTGSSRQPSFVGQQISNIFFYKNRLGFVSVDNVIMSQPLEFFNFWRNSSLTTTDADPIDLKATSLDDVNLFAVHPMTQGLVLFSPKEQFVMTAGNSNVLTPSTASINSVSRYEISPLVDPVLLKDKLYFVAKADSYSRMMSMLTRGDNNNPVVIDESKVVTTWLPKNINRAFRSNQNDLIGLIDNSSNYAYLFRSLDVDGQQPLKTWFSWELPGKILFAAAQQDSIQFIISANSKVSAVTAFINPNEDNPLIKSIYGVITNPSLDYIQTPSGSNKTVSNGVTTITSGVKDPNNSNWTPIVVTTFDSTDPTSSNGKIYAVTKTSDTTYTVDEDLSNIDIQFGFTYPYNIKLPKVYYRQGEAADFTASLTISRFKFAMGKTGNVSFKIQPRAEGDAETIGGVEQSNWYRLDSAPIDDERLFTVPIHQRNDNFDIEISSDSPYPVSLLSMTWEGQYSPRYYRRS